ncbi:MAG: S8 family peptidase [Acidobacteriota bacterium]
MAAERNRRHILVLRLPKTERYKPFPRGGEDKLPRPSNPIGHAEVLGATLRAASAAGDQRRAEQSIEVQGAKPGLYIQFDSQPGFELNHLSLGNKAKQIELVAVRDIEIKEGSDRGKRLQQATVFVPEGRLGHFFDRLNEYAYGQRTKKGRRRHQDMLERIRDLRLATLQSLWTDPADEFPADSQLIWWEVWLRRQDDTEVERLTELAEASGFRIEERRLAFDNRTVSLVQATPDQLAASVAVLSDLAEVRRAKETASFFSNLLTVDQADWLRELRERSTEAPSDAPAVCVLDTGVNRQHPLLEPSLAEEDCHSVRPEWGSHDDGGGPTMQGHGTEMAGLALWGDLTPVLETDAPVELRHGLESVKILPPSGQNPPELYGAITAEATARPESQAPQRRRCFSMAVTSTDHRDRGLPSSWSAAVDALAAGRVFDPSVQGLIYLDDAERRFHRLFVISAGNVSRLERDHLVWSDTEAVHDPAQAWNALVVGATTQKTRIAGPTFEGFSPVAKSGELSPYSTTSVTFASRWPIKPDVVFEGGNTAYDGAGDVTDGVDDLSLLTTYYRPTEQLFVTSWATSAASAQVARMAAQISAEYPDYWPETIRALIVHSAEWTRAMRAHFGEVDSKRKREGLIRRYGFGVPDLQRALRSGQDALTLVVQSQMRPFSNRQMQEMQLHALPWPADALAELGSSEVRLRVTLSYFVEPNPGRRGWKRRHRYASHGFRFDVKKPTESVDEFRKRLNRQALDDGEKKMGSGDSSGWFLGERTREKGSLHSDIWQGTAADLAERGVLGIVPTGGWWKEKPQLDRSASGARYALVVSIESEETEVDLWTPVAAEVGVATDIAVEI